LAKLRPPTRAEDGGDCELPGLYPYMAAWLPGGYLDVHEPLDADFRTWSFGIDSSFGFWISSFQETLS